MIITSHTVSYPRARYQTGVRNACHGPQTLLKYFVYRITAMLDGQCMISSCLKIREIAPRDDGANGALNVIHNDRR